MMPVILRFWAFLTDGHPGRAFLRALAVCLGLSVAIVLVIMVVHAWLGSGPAQDDGPDVLFWAVTAVAVVFYPGWMMSFAAAFWNGQRFVLNS